MDNIVHYVYAIVKPKVKNNLSWKSSSITVSYPETVT